MRVAIVSDIHANLTALEAVLADLKSVGADMVVQGGDLVAGGSRPAEIIDLVRDLRWPGVYGNAEEMLWKSERLSEVLHAPEFRRMRETVLNEVIPATCLALGEERLAWLRSLPKRWSDDHLAVVHAAPDDVWRSPSATAPDEELERTFGPLARRCVVYGHIHHPFVRRLPAFIVANSGCLSLSYDGDPRASYLLVDGDRFEIRRVSYDVEDEASRLLESRYPDAEWLVRILRSGTYMPPPSDEA